MAIGWRGQLLAGITFGHATPQGARRSLFGADYASNPADRLPVWVRRLKSRLEKVAYGMPQDFDDVELDVSHLTPLAQQITSACRAVPWGDTLSYKQLAQRVGRPGAARAVGNVMASNRFPLVVPCHRVVGAAGGLGGFSAPGGIETKRQLLDREALAHSAS
jgi:methylated-DNA-[protein]-cysteine S-methyltransferase